MTLFEYLVTKWLAFVLAVVAVLAVWWFAPAVLTMGFNLNLLWVNAIWGVTYGYLPQEVVLPLEGVQAVYGGLVMAIQAFAKMLPSTAALQTEAAARAILGEGWLLLVEVSIFFRAIWVFWLRRTLRK